MSLNEYIHVIEGESQLVLTMPHSGKEMPEGFPNNLMLKNPEVIKTINAEVDNCVPNVTRAKEYQTASRVWTDIARVYLDVNRLRDQLDQYAIEDGSSEIDAHELIWHATMTDKKENIQDLLSKPYTEDEFNIMLKNFYLPYISSIQKLLLDTHSKHGSAIHFDLHSMPGAQPRHVKEGRYKNAYMFDGNVERGHLENGHMPDLILMDSGTREDIGNALIELFKDYNLIIERTSVRPEGTKGPRQAYFSYEGIFSLGIEIVGHNFEPGRIEGSLKYDNAKEKKFKKAFTEAFQLLEKFKLS